LRPVSLGGVFSLIGIMRIKTNALFYIFGVALIGGCARLDYVKVPTPTQYQRWTDEQQQAADKIKGVRFYLPRPFMHLKRSIPVAQRIAFISFVYDPNTKNYLLDLPPNAPEWVKRVAPKKMSVTQAFAATVLSAPDSTKTSKPAGGLQAGTAGESNKEGQGETNAPVAPMPETPAQTLSATVGYINETDPVTKLSELMDIVYLPDFEEQFVIRPHVGFAGQADIEAKLRNGWAVETFKQKVDNSQLIPYVIRQFQSASDTAAKIATTWLPTATLGLPPNTSFADMMKFMSKGAGGFQSGSATEENAAQFLGRALVFKIAEVRTAQPGVYPILKPREMRQLAQSAPVIGGEMEPDLNLEAFLKAANVPWIRPDMAFIPCPPITVVGFNATIDIFIAAATDRINLGPNQSPPNTASATNSDAELKTKVIDAFVKIMKESAPDELKAVTTSLISLEPQTNGTLKIQMTAAVGKFFKKSSIEAYKNWIESNLKVQNVTVSDFDNAEESESITFNVPAPLSEVAKNLKIK
jgi:hypothetical protein